jgi:hypothetical protein
MGRSQRRSVLCALTGDFEKARPRVVGAPFERVSELTRGSSSGRLRPSATRFSGWRGADEVPDGGMSAEYRRECSDDGGRAYRVPDPGKDGEDERPMRERHWLFAGISFWHPFQTPCCLGRRCGQVLLLYTKMSKTSIPDASKKPKRAFLGARDERRKRCSGSGRC